MESFPHGLAILRNLPLRMVEVYSLTVNLPTQETMYVLAGIVRWVRGEEYWVKTLKIDAE